MAVLFHVLVVVFAVKWAPTSSASRPGLLQEHGALYPGSSLAFDPGRWVALAGCAFVPRVFLLPLFEKEHEEVLQGESMKALPQGFCHQCIFCGWRPGVLIERTLECDASTNSSEGPYNYNSPVHSSSACSVPGRSICKTKVRLCSGAVGDGYEGMSPELLNITYDWESGKVEKHFKHFPALQ